MPPNAVPERDAEALLRRAVRVLKDGPRLDPAVLRSAYRKRLSESGAVVFSLAAAILSARASAEAKSPDDAASTGFPAFPVADGMEDLLALSETCLEDDPYGLEAREPHDHGAVGGDHGRGHGAHGDGSYRDDPFACRFESPYAAAHGAGHGHAHEGRHDGGAASAHAHGAAHGGHDRAGHAHGDHAGHANHAGHGASHAHSHKNDGSPHDGHGHGDVHEDHAAWHGSAAAHDGGHAAMAGPHAHHHAGHEGEAFHGGHGAEAAAHNGVEEHAAAHGPEAAVAEEDAVLADAFAALEPAPAGTPDAHDHGAPAEEGGHVHGFEAALLTPPPAEAPPVEAAPII